MPSTSSIRSSAFAKWAVLSAVVLAGGLALRGEDADACGGYYESIVDLTTFDPKVAGEPVVDGLYYDPYDEGFGGACTDCLAKAMSDDWADYLKGAISQADWDKVLLTATGKELAALAAKLTGKAGQDKLLAAVKFVQLARRVEPFALFEPPSYDGKPAPKRSPPANLMNIARAGMKSKEPFLAQRYAFQALKIAFYGRDWQLAIQFYEKHAAMLATPSTDLAWRARQYFAGALSRTGQKARANLELARIHAGYPALAGAVADDFSPVGDRDWRATLGMAKSVREQTELWRLVGMKKDGVVAIEEIRKLDPKSKLIGLLLVRELARAESRAAERYGNAVDPKEVAAQRKAYARLEQIANAQIAAGGDRPWLMELVAGHIAAKRGDLAMARARLGRATAAQPGNALVASQAKASLAMALVATWNMTPQYEAELAASLASFAPEYSRSGTVLSDVRQKLASAYSRAGKFVEAEFLKRDTVAAAKWDDVAFIKDMIARSGKTVTAFDQFLLWDSFTRANLEQDLAMRYVILGDFASAAKLYQTAKPVSEQLGTDPFVIHIRDCHDCDHVTYEKAKWTHANFVARLVELEQKAKGGGEAGAEAALLLGNALYNITYHGNARVVLAASHQSTNDASAAQRWYKRAYDTTKNRELKAKAAFLAAKAELGNLVNGLDAYTDPLPIPKTWFPVVKSFSDTRYYKEVLAECGHFRQWAKK